MKETKSYLFDTKTWIKIALINFCVVAIAGITLRYKINFPLPVLNQKFLLHSHSHFAFTGWVTLILMTFMVYYLQLQNVKVTYKKYYWILLANCITAYGMFFSFIVEGYALSSITFSTLSIFVSYFFIFFYWRDINQAKDQSYAPIWFKAALIIWGISSLGAFTLAFLMANKIMVQDYYFAAVYFFLHFQYNGWFLFVCFGLLSSFLYRNGFLSTIPINKKLFMVLAITVGPTYFLSVLWLKLPSALHLLADAAGILQLVVLVYFIQLLMHIKKKIQPAFNATTKVLWIMAAVAFIIKIVLQMLSIIPFLNSYAFGFRPIVIGYLHLSFLGIISFFLLGCIYQIFNSYAIKISKTGCYIFMTGVLLQEVILMFQGLEVMAFEPLPYANLILFFSAIVIGTGLIWITLSIQSSDKPKIEIEGLVN